MAKKIKNDSSRLLTFASDEITDSINTDEAQLKSLIQDIKRNINDLMIEQGYSPAQFAELCGISKSTLARLIETDSSLTLETTLCAIHVLQVPVENVIPLNKMTEKKFGDYVEELCKSLTPKQKTQVFKILIQIVYLFNVDHAHNDYKQIPRYLHDIKIAEKNKK